jgi:hypothetical protein
LKVPIDFSIFTREKGAFGYVSGSLEFAVEPMVGDSIALMLPIHKAMLPTCVGTSSLRVEGRNHLFAPAAPPFTVSLSNLEVATVQEAVEACRYFEQGFGLFANIYDLDIEL